MKRTLMAAFKILTAILISVNALGQAPVTPKVISCRIIDVIILRTGEAYYVDGKKLPGHLTIIEYLRSLEATAPCSCLKVFVPTSVKLQDIEDLRVVAGIMQIEDFHAYLYDEHRDTVTEILPGPPIPTTTIRSGPGGPVPWPDRRIEHH
jgi:hypothetical protein